MEREQAEARCAELNRERPDRAKHHWIAQHAGPDGWRAVRVNVPGMRFEVDPLKASTVPVRAPKLPRTPGRW